MRISTVIRRIAPIALALFAACSDRAATSPDRSTAPADAAFNVAVPQCASYDDARTIALINTVYGQQLSASTATGQTFWTNIKAASTTATKTTITWDFVDDILTRKQAPPGRSSTPEMVELINRLFCNVRVAAAFPGGDGWVIRASEGGATQNLVNPARYAAFVVPANTITNTTGPRLFTISASATPSLNTALDQYGTAQEFSVYPSSTIFARTPIIVGLCGGAADPAVTARLKLGHKRSSSVFEVLPIPANNPIPSLLNCFSISAGASSDQVGCETAVASRATPFIDRLWAALLPTKAYAATMTGGCAGIGGNLSELSPVRPVDPVILVAAASQPISGLTANTGFPVWPSPAVVLRTAKGTSVTGVPVTFSTSAGKVVAPAAVSSGSSGVSTLNFWTMGTKAGQSATLTARPGIGGGAVANTSFSPTSIAFSAASTTASTSGTPASVIFSQAPPANAIINGAFTVRVTVRNSTLGTVTNYNGPVVLTTSVGTLGGQTVVQAVNGVANFSVFFLNSGTRTLTATAAYDGATRTVTSGNITVP